MIYSLSTASGERSPYFLSCSLEDAASSPNDPLLARIKAWHVSRFYSFLLNLEKAKILRELLTVECPPVNGNNNTAMNLS